MGQVDIIISFEFLVFGFESTQNQNQNSKTVNSKLLTSNTKLLLTQATMNFEKIRATKFYNRLMRVSNQVFSPKVFKSKFELYYWKVKKWEEKELTNQHYEYFYTTYFKLTKDFYNDKKILDIGCGPRGSLEWANMTAERIGLDPLADQYLKLGAAKHAMQYINSGSENMPFADNHFDVIASFNSLDHVDNLTATIREIKRVLAPNGLFLLIADIHDTPTICEPSNFSWDIVQRFAPELAAIEEFHFEGHRMYQSIREGVPFNHGDPKQRYGVLTVKMKKIMDGKQ